MLCTISPMKLVRELLFKAKNEFISSRRSVLHTRHWCNWRLNRIWLWNWRMSGKSGFSTNSTMKVGGGLICFDLIKIPIVYRCFHNKFCIPSIMSITLWKGRFGESLEDITHRFYSNNRLFYNFPFLFLIYM